MGSDGRLPLIWWPPKIRTPSWTPSCVIRPCDQTAMRRYSRPVCWLMCSPGVSVRHPVYPVCMPNASHHNGHRMVTLPIVPAESCHESERPISKCPHSVWLRNASFLPLPLRSTTNCNLIVHCPHDTHSCVCLVPPGAPQCCPVLPSPPVLSTVFDSIRCWTSRRNGDKCEAVVNQIFVFERA